MKKKTIFLIFLVLFIAIAMLIWFQSRSNSEKENIVSFRMAEVMNPEHPSAQASKYFTDLVRARSKGKIDIQLYYTEELGDADEILEQVEYGGIAFARVNSLDVVEKVISMESDFKQYAYENPDSMMNWLATHNSIIEEKFKEKNMKALVWYYPDFRCFYNMTENINDIDDFRGLKINTAETNLMKSSMSMLVASAVNVNNADILRSLKAGYINAGETSFGEFVLSDYYDMVSFVTLTNYISCPDMIVTNIASMDSLSPDDQKLIETCAKDTYSYQKKQMRLFQAKYIKKAEKEKNLFLESDNFSRQLKMVLTKDREDEKE